MPPPCVTCRQRYRPVTRCRLDGAPPSEGSTACCATRTGCTSASCSLLTFSTGVVDAIGYLGLDKVFTANMTGNVVILAMGLTGQDGLPIVGPVVALVGFVVGAAIAGRLLRGVPKGWHRRDTTVLAIVAGLLLVALVPTAFVTSTPGRPGDRAAGDRAARRRDGHAGGRGPAHRRHRRDDGRDHVHAGGPRLRLPRRAAARGRRGSGGSPPWCCWRSARCRARRSC